MGTQEPIQLLYGQKEAERFFITCSASKINRHDRDSSSIQQPVYRLQAVQKVR